MFNQKDLIHVQNLQRLLSKSKMELDSSEILAAADVLRWVALLGQQIQEDLKRQELQATLLKGEPAIVVPEQQVTQQSLSDRAKKTRKAQE